MKNVNGNKKNVTPLNDKVLNNVNGGVGDTFIKALAKKIGKSAKKIWDRL